MKQLMYIIGCLVVLNACSEGTSVEEQSNEEPMNSSYLYIGTYTKYPPHASGNAEGIYVYKMNTETGALDSVGMIANIVNPSYLAIHPNKQLLYAINEHGADANNPTGAVSAFTIDEDTKQLTIIDTESVGGDAPCHISFDATHSFILTANYVGGNVAVLPISSDGRLEEVSANIKHQGSGTHPRQAAPHAHFFAFEPNGTYAVAVDLGLDQVLKYELTPEGQLAQSAQPFYETAAEAGPRHLIFSTKGDVVYILNELNSTIEVGKVENGQAENIQTLSTLPEGYEGEGNCAAIKLHPNGKYLYASNRRDHHSIAVFEIQEDGTIQSIQHISTKGDAPRDFEIDPSGQFLLAANQNSDNIITFKIDQNTGKLIDTGLETKVPTPVCIKFL